MAHRTSSLGLFAIAVLLDCLSPAPPALAADLDPPYLGSQQFPEDKVEFGTGWYIRGDIAESQKYALELAQVGRVEYFGIRRTEDIGYDVSLGGGYKFTNFFRGDVTVDFHQPVQLTTGATCIDSPTNFCTIRGKFNHYDALINGYVDLGTWYKVTPYVGAGVGVGFGETKSTLIGDSTLYVAKYGYQKFAWALMAGVGVDVFDHTKLDVGYRYLNDGTVAGVRVYHHEFRAGLRYLIDD